nr:reverse transcriptase domain-containing protein [Tanacetum cinerariifolium]
MVRALLLDKKNQSLAPAPSSTPALVKAVEPNYVTCGGAHAYQNCPATNGNIYRDNIQEYMSQAAAANYNQGNIGFQPQMVVNQIRPPGTGTLPSNTIINPKEDLKGITTRSGVAYQRPTIPTPTKVVKQGTEEKLSEMARTPKNEHCSSVILNKFPRKLGDPGKFLIPCEFPGMDECLALADLGASINLMPLSVCEGLSLLELTPNCMTLELADRSVSKPIGITKDVSVKGDNKLAVIIAKTLGDEEKSAPIKVLNSHKRAIAWKLSDIQGNEFYCFLDGFFGYFQIPIDPRDQEKTTFTCPYETFAYRCMPFGLCNAPGTFERCMLAIFHDMVEKIMEVFMDDVSVFGNSFENCLSRLDKMLQRCEDTNLCLNWEKRHFMVKEGIVLGHEIFKNRIEVDKAKVDVIAKLPNLTTVK